MITATSENLPEGAQERLAQWLKKPECGVLLRVILARGTMASVTAINKALESNKFAAKLDDAKADLDVAMRYQHALEVLKEISDVANSKTPLTTTKLS